MSPNQMPRKAAPQGQRVIGWSNDGELVSATVLRPLAKPNRIGDDIVLRSILGAKVGLFYTRPLS